MSLGEYSRKYEAEAQPGRVTSVLQICTDRGFICKVTQIDNAVGAIDQITDGDPPGYVVTPIEQTDAVIAGTNSEKYAQKLLEAEFGGKTLSPAERKQLKLSFVKKTQFDQLDVQTGKYQPITTNLFRVTLPSEVVNKLLQLPGYVEVSTDELLRSDKTVPTAQLREGESGDIRYFDRPNESNVISVPWRSAESNRLLQPDAEPQSTIGVAVTAEDTANAQPQFVDAVLHPDCRELVDQIQITGKESGAEMAGKAEFLVRQLEKIDADYEKRLGIKPDRITLEVIELFRYAIDPELFENLKITFMAEKLATVGLQQLLNQILQGTLVWGTLSGLQPLSYIALGGKLLNDFTSKLLIKSISAHAVKSDEKVSFSKFWNQAIEQAVKNHDISNSPLGAEHKTEVELIQSLSKDLPSALKSRAMEGAGSSVIPSVAIALNGLPLIAGINTGISLLTDVFEVAYRKTLKEVDEKVKTKKSTWSEILELTSEFLDNVVVKNAVNTAITIVPDTYKQFAVLLAGFFTQGSGEQIKDSTNSVERTEKLGKVTELLYWIKTRGNWLITEQQYQVYSEQMLSQTQTEKIRGVTLPRRSRDIIKKPPKPFLYVPRKDVIVVDHERLEKLSLIHWMKKSLGLSPDAVFPTRKAESDGEREVRCPVIDRAILSTLEDEYNQVNLPEVVYRMITDAENIKDAVTLAETITNIGKFTGVPIDVVSMVVADVLNEAKSSVATASPKDKKVADPHLKISIEQAISRELRRREKLPLGQKEREKAALWLNVSGVDNGKVVLDGVNFIARSGSITELGGEINTVTLNMLAEKTRAAGGALFVRTADGDVDVHRQGKRSDIEIVGKKPHNYAFFADTNLEKSYQKIEASGLFSAGELVELQHSLFADQASDAVSTTDGETNAATESASPSNGDLAKQKIAKEGVTSIDSWSRSSFARLALVEAFAGDQTVIVLNKWSEEIEETEMTAVAQFLLKQIEDKVILVREASPEKRKKCHDVWAPPGKVKSYELKGAQLEQSELTAQQIAWQLKHMGVEHFSDPLWSERVDRLANEVVAKKAEFEVVDNEVVRQTYRIRVGVSTINEKTGKKYRLRQLSKVEKNLEGVLERGSRPERDDGLALFRSIKVGESPNEAVLKESLGQMGLLAGGGITQDEPYHRSLEKDSKVSKKYGMKSQAVCFDKYIWVKWPYGDNDKPKEAFTLHESTGQTDYDWEEVKDEVPAPSILTSTAPRNSVWGN